MPSKNTSLYRTARRLIKGDTEFDFSKLKDPSTVAKDEIIHVRGRQVISREAAARRSAERLQQEPGQGIAWGGIRIPDKTHFLYVGQTRSGKSLLIRQLMQDVFSRFGKGANQRAVVYDPSTELISFLYKLAGDRIPIYILNPLDERCTPWKISADVEDYEAALNLGHIIFPKGDGADSKSEYFSEAPATLMAGLINCFILTNEERETRDKDRIDWTLRDVCVSLSDDNDAKALLRQRWDTRKTAKYLESNNPDLDRTIINKFTRLDSVAARWHNSEREPKSLRDFIQSKDSSILVLGGSTNVTVEALNRVIFDKLAEMLLDNSVPSETDSRTWLFIDEFSDLGKMDTMGKLLSMGLKKGVRVVAAYQNIAAVEKVYGKYDPEIIKSEIATIAFLRQQGNTAKETSNFIGEREVKRLRLTYGKSQDIAGGHRLGSNESEEYAPDKMPVVPPDDLELPEAGPVNGVSGYFLTLSVRDIFRHRFQWRELSTLASLKSNEPDFKKNNSREAKRLKPWSKKERLQWGLAPLDGASENHSSPEGEEPAPTTQPKEKPDLDAILDFLDEREKQRSQSR